MAVKIQKVFFHYYPEARHAKSFDTNETDFGLGSAFITRGCRVDLENAATATMYLSTDLPGNAMAARENKAIALHASSRRTITIHWGAEYKANLAQLILSGTDFYLFGLQVEVLPIGEYISGIHSEDWDSDIQDFNTERVKMIKEIELDFEHMDASDTLTLTVYSDLPGGAMTSRTTKTTTAGLLRKTAKFRLPGTIRGRLFRFTISSGTTKDFILYSARAWVKTIGEPNASGWTWLNLPVKPTNWGDWQFVNVPIDSVK